MRHVAAVGKQAAVAHQAIVPASCKVLPGVLPAGPGAAAAQIQAAAKAAGSHAAAGAQAGGVGAGSFGSAGAATFGSAAKAALVAAALVSAGAGLGFAMGTPAFLSQAGTPDQVVTATANSSSVVAAQPQRSSIMPVGNSSTALQPSTPGDTPGQMQAALAPSNDVPGATKPGRDSSPALDQVPPTSPPEVTNTETGTPATSVPEPASLLLLGVGATATVLLARRAVARRR